MKKLPIVNKIRELRGKKTQRQLGTQAGIDQQLISKWERGFAYPDAANLIRLAQIAPSPLCWDFYEAAGLYRPIVLEKLEAELTVAEQARLSAREHKRFYEMGLKDGFKAGFAAERKLGYATAFESWKKAGNQASKRRWRRA